MALTIREQTLKLLDLFTAIFELQLNETETPVMFPFIDGKRHVHAGYYEITSNEKFPKIVELIEHYTLRIESSQDKTLLKNELKRIYDKASNVVDTCDNKLGPLSKSFIEKQPKEFKAQQEYLKKSKGIYHTMNLGITHVVYGKQHGLKDDLSWMYQDFNYQVTNFEIASRVYKLLEFINDTGLVEQKDEQKKKINSSELPLQNNDGAADENSKNDKEDVTEYTYFKIGVLFAKGIPQQLRSKYKNEKGYFKKITLELGFKETDRVYFSETLNNSTKTNKNIYSQQEKLQQIKEYCDNNNISICADFLNNYSSN